MTAVALATPVRRSQPVPGRLGGTPYEQGDVVGLVSMNVVGSGLLLAGIVGTRGSLDPERVLLFVNIASVGLVVGLVANAVFLLTCLRSVSTLRLVVLGTAAPGEQVAVRTDAVELDEPVDDDALVSTDVMTRYHLASCPAVRGKGARAAHEDEHLAAGRRPCGMCLSEETT